MRMKTKGIWMGLTLVMLTTLAQAQTNEKESSLPDFQGELREISLEELEGPYKKSTEETILELQRCIQIIGSKETSKDKKDLAFKNAIQMFIPGSTIQVSSGKKGAKVESYTVGEYLRRLRALNYQEVEITFDKVYMGSYRKGPDGKYYTTATFEQKFKGTTTAGTVYEDKTKKSVDVSMENTMDDADKEVKWMVKLGNIKVLETKTPDKPIN